MQPSEVITQLSTLRKRIRRRLVVYGCCAVVAGGIISFLTIVTLDWLLWLPPLLRVVVGVIFLAGFVGATMYWIVQPLRAKLSLSEIAGRIEQHITPLQDRLTSTVDFLTRGDAGSPRMMQQAVSNTAGIVKEMPLEEALSLKPLMKQCFWCLASFALLFAVLGFLPGWTQIGGTRYLDPFGGAQWPRNVAIVPLTGNQVVAMGESAEVRMSIARGLHDTLRGIVYLQERREGEPPGEPSTLALYRDAQGVFSTTIDVVTRDLQYWFEAGDDTTRDGPFRIRVVRRPEVIEALAVIEPPPYALERMVRVHDLADGPVPAPVGGFARITLRASKPIPLDAGGGRVGLRLSSGELIPLFVDSQDPSKLTARFEVRGDMEFRAELRDEQGFGNRGAARYSIRATPDTRPGVAILEPSALTEMTPGGSIPLLIRVVDDFGVRRLELQVTRSGSESAYTVSLTDRLEIERRESGLEAMVRYTWNVESLSLAPGDVLTCVAVAWDNYATADGKGQRGRSAPMRVRVISQVEFAVRQRSDLARLEKRLREAALDQADLLDQTRTLVGSDDGSLAETEAESELPSTAPITARQVRLTRRSRELARQFFNLAGRMERGGAGAGGMHGRVHSLGEGLQQTASGPMNGAVDALNRIPNSSAPPDRRGPLVEAADFQAAAVEQLERLIHATALWGDFQSLLTTARDLLERQESLRARTSELGRSMLGKSVNALTPEEAGRLKRTRRKQGQLADDVGHLLVQMQAWQGRPEEGDAAGGDAVESALRAARANDLTQRLRSAVSALQSNRTGAAAMEQKAAAQGLRKMAAALRQRAERELEQLRKRLDDARRQVALLIEDQEALQTATHEADLLGVDKDAFHSLYVEQRRLQRNTDELGRSMLRKPRLASAGDSIRRSAAFMKEAKERLEDQQARDAETAQDGALALLRDALARLEQLAQQTADEALRRTLRRIQEALEAVRTAQLQIHDGATRLKAAIDPLERFGRRQAREARKLAGQQAEVRTRVDALLPDLEQVVVYRWALARAARWMEAVRQTLYVPRVDGELLATTERIIRELDKLIDAIVETASFSTDQEFQEATGGGQSASGSGKPVPTLTELLVLKTMQRDIHDRSRQLYQSFDIERATEQQLRELTMLGEDQREVRRLTELVTNQARQGP